MMPTGIVGIRMRDVTRSMVVNVSIQGLMVSRLRFAIAKPFIRLGFWIAGIGGVKYDE